MRSKNVLWDVELTSENIVLMELPKKELRNMTWGVFKAYAFFTPSVSAGCNIFAIVCVSVRLSFRLTILAKPMYIQTSILAYTSYLKISRVSSKVKVIGQRSRSLSPKMSSYTVIFQAVYRKPS